MHKMCYYIKIVTLYCVLCIVVVQNKKIDVLKKNAQDTFPLGNLVILILCKLYTKGNMTHKQNFILQDCFI